MNVSMLRPGASASRQPSASTRTLRAIVFGYGELGAACVDQVSRAGCQVAGVGLPSNRSGRDFELIQEAAETRKLASYIQPPRKLIGPFAETLHLLGADLFVIWSYSMILPP